MKTQLLPRRLLLTFNVEVGLEGGGAVVISGGRGGDPVMGAVERGCFVKRHVKCQM